jgi:hypothetical protein
MVVSLIGRLIETNPTTWLACEARARGMARTRAVSRCHDGWVETSMIIVWLRFSFAYFLLCMLYIAMLLSAFSFLHGWLGRLVLLPCSHS